MFVSCDSTGDRREPVYTSFEKNKETTSSRSTIPKPQGLFKLQFFVERPNKQINLQKLIKKTIKYLQS
jgi:hypothetical protein